MSQGVVVYLAPVAMHEGADQQQQRRLGLMEVGDEHLDYLIVVARGDDNLRRGVEYGLTVTVVPRQHVLQRLLGRDGGCALIGFPLTDMQVVSRQRGVVFQLQSHVVEAFEGTYAGGSDGDGLTVVGQQTLDGLTAHGNILRMHGVLADGLALDRTEGARTDMQRNFLPLDTTGIDGLQYSRREMQSGGRCCHAALDFRIDRLIGGLVALLCLAVQVRRNGQFTHGVEDFSEGSKQRRM